MKPLIDVHGIASVEQRMNYKAISVILINAS